jgi:hypothetical protein
MVEVYPLAHIQTNQMVEGHYNTNYTYRDRSVFSENKKARL